MSAVLKIKMSGGHEVKKYFKTPPTAERINKSLVDFKIGIDDEMLYDLLEGFTVNIRNRTLNYEDIEWEEYK